MCALKEAFLSLLQHFGSHGYEPHWFSKPDVWEGHLSSAGLKCWGADVGYEPLSPQGDAPGL